MGNCFTHESSGRIRIRSKSKSKSKSKSESRPPPSSRAVSPLNEDTTPEKRQPLPPAAQTTRAPNCLTDKNRAKKKVRFADEAVCSEVKKEEEVTMRVKIVMRKKDVALLLAMLSAGDDQSVIASSRIS